MGDEGRKERCGAARASSVLLFLCGMVASALWPSLAAANTINFLPSDHYTPVTHFVSYLREHGAVMTVDDAQAQYEAGHFQAVNQHYIDLGVIQDGVWLSFSIRNDSRLPTMVLEIRNPRLSHVDFYRPSKAGGFLKTETGTARPFYNRSIWHPMPSFELAIPPGETQQFFVRVYNTGNMRMQFLLWNAPRFHERIQVAYNPELITIGMVLSLAVFHLLVYMALWIPSYLHLSFFLSAWLLFFMSLNGTGPMLLWPDNAWLGERAPTLFTLLMAASFNAFVISLLEARRRAPLLCRLAYGVGIACILAILYSSFNESILRIHLVTILAVSTSVVTIAMAIFVALKGNRTALLFLCLWGVLLVGVLGVASLGLYIMPDFITNGYAINLMFIGCVLLWSFELTGRVRSRIMEERSYLEEKVGERTRELQDALNQVKTLRGLLPICSSCKKIRDDEGTWNSIEKYIVTKTEADLTHGICPDCCKKLYPELYAQGVFDFTRKPSGYVSEANEPPPKDA